MIITYIKRRYHVYAHDSDSHALIKELTMAIRMLAQDHAMMTGENIKLILVDVICNLEEAYGILRYMNMFAEERLHLKN